MILRRLSFWIAILGIFLTIDALWGAGEKPIAPPPLETPPTNPYAATVAAAGIIEAINENVRIAPPVSGLITQVHVAVSDRVERGAPLFQLDDRELRARLRTREFAIPSAKARIAEQRVLLKDLIDQLKRFQAVQDRRAVSVDDIKRKWHEVEMAKHALLRAQTDLKLIKT